MFSLSTIGLVGLVLGVPLLVFFLVRFVYWWRISNNLKNSGYMPPPSSRFARGFFKGACRLITRIFVGPLTVIGEQNAYFKGRGLVLPNHVFIWDFAVYGAAIPFAYRQIAKYAEIAFLPVRIFAAWIGTVGVQVEEGKIKDGLGDAVVAAGAKVLKSSKGSRLLMAPQGRLIYSGKVLSKDFRTGATRILEETVEQLTAEAAMLPPDQPVEDNPVYAQPAAVYYLRDKRYATRLQRILYPMGLRFLRTVRWTEVIKDESGRVINEIKHKDVIYGVIVELGEPIPVADLPKGPRPAIEHIRLDIQRRLEGIEDMLEGAQQHH
jgi:1-acyl-sn-glycerol-3-phosphate acyltransferase